MINKILFLAIFVLMSFSFAENWDGSTSKPTSKEIDGVPYYVITSPSELAWFAYQVNNKDSLAINARLGNDIHFTDDTSATSSTTWLQISNNASKPFKGIIDGNGYSIYGIYGSYVIGYLDTIAVFKNINFRASSLTSFVLENKGLVSSVNNYGKVRNGIVEKNYSRIQYCKNIAKASDYRAGIAYTNYSTGIINFCENSAYNNSSSGVDSLGGISVINKGLIDSCKSNVVVYNAFANYTSFWSYKEYYSVRIGGVAAVNGNGAVIRNSSAKLKITNHSSDYANQYKYFGGIAAVNGGVIENVYNAELILGALGSWDEIYIGGVAGTTSGGTIKSVNSSVHIRRYSPYTYYNEGINGIIMGGVLGELTSNGNVNEAFGLLSIDSVKKATISLSETRMPSPYNIGGLLGSADGAVISNSHSVVEVTNFLNESGFQAALLIGNCENAQVFNSYGVGYVKGDSSSIAGLIRNNDSRSSVSNSYYDITLLNVSAIKNNGSSSVINANGKTTAVMQSPAFVETLNTNAGLDDDSGLWQYCEGNYPILIGEGSCEEFYSKYGHQSSSSSSIEYKTMTDSRDGQTYKIVTIGTQTWMAENLNYDYNKETATSYCYRKSSANCDKYGRLYKWSAAMDSAAIFTKATAGRRRCGDGWYCYPSGIIRGVCPEGWHLPNKDEWDTLFTVVGGINSAGTKLKSTSGWNNGGSGTDAFGFSVLPAGYADSVFRNVGFNARFWSSSEWRNDAAYNIYFNYIDENVRVDSTVYSEKSDFRSVRCLRDSVEDNEATSSSSSAQPTSSASSSSSNEIISSSSELFSSSSVFSSSSNVVSSSSSEITFSSSETSTSSSSNEKISSSSTTIVDLSSSSESITATFSMASANFNVQVQGLTINIFNAKSGPVQVFDMLGHLVATRNSVEGHASITLPHSGNYIVKVNGNVRNVQVR